MKAIQSALAVTPAVLALLAVSSLPVLAAPGDFDGTNYVDQTDVTTFMGYFGDPDDPYGSGGEVADFDQDGDVDLEDFITFQRLYGHTPIPLKDALGSVIVSGQTMPYSSLKTCGGVGCHDTDIVGNSYQFQHGRTDFDGNIVGHDDYFGDGRFWIKGPARYGVWGQSFQFLLAAKNNTHPSQIDQTSFAWIRDCGGCHSGGGAGTHDRDGELLYNVATGQFGYQVLGKTPEQVALDGDYSVQNYTTGQVTLAAWDVTGLSEPDCLYCHRSEIVAKIRGESSTFGAEDEILAGDGPRSGNYLWRRNVLATGTALQDNAGNPVPAFLAAAVAGQGWFSTLNTSVTPPRLQIDYGVGVANGSLVLGESNEVQLDPLSMARPPRDKACVSCHPLATVTGTVWFDDRDVHFAKLTRHNDNDPEQPNYDPYNDIPSNESTACNYCHPGNLQHEFGKGNSLQIQQRNELDYDYDLLGFRSCRDCHLAGPKHHPDAPIPGTSPDYGLHDGSVYPMANVLSCQACHIPYALTAGLVYRDITMPMISIAGSTSQYYSADPLDPTNPDKSKWYPSFMFKTDSDGVERLFPASVWVNIYWGDWNDNGTPGDLSDDIIAPIATWRVKQAIGATPLPVTTDDNADGVLEINRPEEILAYINVLEGNDSNGQQIAARPVLVKGVRVWYEDSGAPTGVNSFDHRGTGIPITSYPYIWDLDHNVLKRTEAFGAGGPSAGGCDYCHYYDEVFGRKLLVDPFNESGQPVYEELRQWTPGIDPLNP